MPRSERDYLERTILTVRNHRSADNCWPQWANIFADEIERLWQREADLEDELRGTCEMNEQSMRTLREVVKNREAMEEELCDDGVQPWIDWMIESVIEDLDTIQPRTVLGDGPDIRAAIGGSA